MIHSREHRRRHYAALLASGKSPILAEIYRIAVLEGSNTQSSLARELGCTPIQVSRWFSAKIPAEPTVQSLHRLCASVGLKLIVIPLDSEKEIRKAVGMFL